MKTVSRALFALFFLFSLPGYAGIALTPPPTRNEPIGDGFSANYALTSAQLLALNSTLFSADGAEAKKKRTVSNLGDDELIRARYRLTYTLRPGLRPSETVDIGGNDGALLLMSYGDVMIACKGEYQSQHCEEPSPEETFESLVAVVEAVDHGPIRVQPDVATAYSITRFERQDGSIHCCDNPWTAAREAVEHQGLVCIGSGIRLLFRVPSMPTARDELPSQLSFTFDIYLAVQNHSEVLMDLWPLSLIQFQVDPDFRVYTLDEKPVSSKTELEFTGEPYQVPGISPEEAFNRRFAFALRMFEAADKIEPGSANQLMSELFEVEISDWRSFATRKFKKAPAEFLASIKVVLNSASPALYLEREAEFRLEEEKAAIEFLQKLLPFLRKGLQDIPSVPETEKKQPDSPVDNTI